MEFVAHVKAKVEAETIDGESKYTFHIGMQLNRNNLEAQEGQGIIAGVQVTVDEWNQYEVGDDIYFMEVDRSLSLVPGDKDA